MVCLKIPNADKINYPELLYASFFILSVILALIPLPSGISVYLPLLIGLIYYLLYFSRAIDLKGSRNHLFLYLMSICMLTSQIYTCNFKLYHIFYIWGYGGIAQMLYSFKNSIRTKVINCVFIVTSCALLIPKFVGISADVLLANSSRNGINEIIILYTAITYILLYEKNEELPSIYAIVCLIVSLYSEGRSGIIVSAVLLLAIIGYNYLINKKISVNCIAYIMMVIIGVLFVAFIFRENIVSILNRFIARGFDTPRYEIWREYFQALRDKPAGIIFGGKYIDPYYPLIFSHKGNLHNAFFMLHANYGIVGLCIVSILLVKCIRRICIEKNYVKAVLLFVLILRSMFDWTAFPANYDVLFYYFFFDSLSKRRIGNQDVICAL